MTRILLLYQGKLIRWVFRLVGLVMRVPWLRRRFPRRMAMLGEA